MNPKVSQKPSQPHSNDAKLTVPPLVQPDLLPHSVTRVRQLGFHRILYMLKFSLSKLSANGNRRAGIDFLSGGQTVELRPLNTLKRNTTAAMTSKV